MARARWPKPANSAASRSWPSATPPPRPPRGWASPRSPPRRGDGEALAELVRRRLDPKAGPLLHVSGVDIAQDFAASLAPDGFEVRRVALYDAREETALPDSARAAIEARALDAAMFFSPRASALFARLVQEAGPGRLPVGRHRHRHQPCGAPALERPAIQGDGGGVAPDPPVRAGRDRPAARRDRRGSAVEGPSIMSDTPSSSDTTARRWQPPRRPSRSAAASAWSAPSSPACSPPAWCWPAP